MLAELGRRLLNRLDPERAHDLALLALAHGLVPLPQCPKTSRLAVRLKDLSLPHPVGLAAGFDKNARALPALVTAGFSFIEVGAVTPRPQPGNPKPRLFRLAEERAIINRFGFNNDGAEAVARRLAQRPKGALVGINLGANRDSPAPWRDFAHVLAVCGAHVDFATVNVSSPNTPGLRALQKTQALRQVIFELRSVQENLPHPVAIFLKIAPDLSPGEIDAIAGLAHELGIDGIVATNTTVAREGLLSPNAAEPGGLSGQPLFERATRVLARLYRALGGQIPLIGVGGIDSVETAWEKIRAGANAVQLYTGLIYRGFGLLPEILAGLERKLSECGAKTLAEVVGTGVADWT